MRPLSLFLILTLAGCASDAPSTASNSVSLPTTANPDNPPVKLSGYAETSYTKQIH
jgi:hypothetical protein